MRGLVALAALAAGGCLKTVTFHCADDTDCVRNGAAGICEPTSFCSFDDLACAGGRRYGDLSGSYAGQCVGSVDVDGGVDAPPGCSGTGLVQVCLVSQPAESLVLTGTLDTDTSPSCVAFTSPTGTSACLVAGQGITVRGTFSATGSKPLVLVSTTVITIEAGATLDVSSRRDPMRIGAGGDSPLCTAGTAATQGTTGGGGCAGSFGGKGGDGGAGGGAVGGIAAAASGSPSQLRGGCAGGIGGGSTGGAGGHGGGAVFLIASQSIQVDGTINASGGGGSGARAGADQAGGGGGGSGGMIGLDAPTVTITGAVFANGGGGGEGGGTGFDGVPGTESTAPTTAGLGGIGPTVTYGGDGGNGSVGTMLDGVAGMADTTDGAGGGGGGAGVIRIFASQSSGQNLVSPPPS